MKKIIFLLPYFLIMLSSTSLSLASEATLNKSCSITCYEKTPTCYVTKDDKGCLVISNEKPTCSKGSCVCKIEGCETKTTY